MLSFRATARVQPVEETVRRPTPPVRDERAQAARSVSCLAAYRARIAQDKPTPATAAAAVTIEPTPIPVSRPIRAAAPRQILEIARISPVVRRLRDRVQDQVFERMDIQQASNLSRPELARELDGLVRDIIGESRVTLNANEQHQLVSILIDEMIGLGPLEPLLDDPAVTDIMVNAPDQVFVERKGRLELTDVSFRDQKHILNLAQRIVTAIGRRVDETNPMVDARLADGSRVNVIVPPLALNGPTISIRKFARQTISLDKMVENGSMSVAMATVLKIAARCRLNILVSGGTGSGKTTLLNAMSEMVDNGERIVTIEDAAELQLQQEHTIRLETRPANIEGRGEISARDLVKNALRMRPDRIILGEVRGSEVVDMLQAMNTGHEGSLGTVHANRPRESLTRLENMVAMAGLNLPVRAVRAQIAEALDLVVQVTRMRDGVRRVTSITEVVGMEGDVITTQELFRYEFEGEEANGTLRGRWVSAGLRPHCAEKARYYGLERTLLEAL